MATNYPGSLDAFTNPTSGDNLSTSVGGRTHSQLHRDVNDAIEAMQAEDGTNPSGGYATVKARLAALDHNVFDVMDPTYGGVVDGSTDDTAAWQAAIDACATAGGGIVTSSKNGVSVIAGALQDTGGANAQILLPSIHVTSGEQISISIRGLTAAPPELSVVGAMTLPDNHLVLKSTLGSGTGAMVGVKGPSGSPDGFSNIHADVSLLSLRMPSNPTNSCLDLRRATSANVSEVVVDVGTYDATAVTEPTTTTSFGVRLPTNNNGARATMTHANVIGFYNGIEHAEHANLDDVNVWGCKVGLVPTATNHASHYKRVGVYHCERGIKPTGTHALDVQQLNIEHASTGWMTTDYDIDDASNYLSGNVRWWAVLAGTGAHNSFTVNGATGVTKSRVGAALMSGTYTQYVYRDRLTAASGDTILTLGATPIDNSPLVWVNGAIKWPTTDYTISSNVITFNSGLSASDVVAVQYHSTASSAGTTSLAAASITILDNFNRANSASSLGTTSTGSLTWSQLLGTWGIDTNKAYVQSSHASTLNAAVIDSTAANVTASAVITATTGTPIGGIVVRGVDASNFCVIEITVGSAYTPKIYKCVAGSYTVIATGSSITFASGDTLSVVTTSTTITVKRNGSTIVSVTDSTLNTATKQGIYQNQSSGATSIIRHDDFSVTS